MVTVLPYWRGEDDVHVRNGWDGTKNEHECGGARSLLTITTLVLPNASTRVVKDLYPTEFWVGSAVEACNGPGNAAISTSRHESQRSGSSQYQDGRRVTDLFDRNLHQPFRVKKSVSKKRGIGVRHVYRSMFHVE